MDHTMCWSFFWPSSLVGLSFLRELNGKKRKVVSLDLIVILWANIWVIRGCCGVALRRSSQSQWTHLPQAKISPVRVTAEIQIPLLGIGLWR